MLVMDAPVREGDVLAGKYRVDKVLGVGGMGVVVAAHHIQLDERVALKFLLPEMLGNSEAVGRFEREARAAVKIKSEHVARVSDVGTLENGSPYMVMEFLEGGDLSAWVHQRGALPVEQAVEFVLQACEAIAEAHGLGIIHRDLKPANLFCVRRADGLLSIKVLDFGISKVTALGASGADMGLTKTQSMMGSPLYMSPEQMQSAKNVDFRTDIWALGVILYELVTGQVPFNGEGLPELVLNVVSSRPQPIRNLRPDAPDGLEEVIFRCLEKNRERRYGNVAELAVALVEFGPKRARGSVERVSRVIQASGLSTSPAVLPPSMPPPAQAVASGTVGSWGRTAPGGGGAKKALAGAGVTVAVGIVVAVVLLARKSPHAGAETNAAAGIVVQTATSAVAQPSASPPDVPAMPIAVPSVSVAAPDAGAGPVLPIGPASRNAKPAANKPAGTATTAPAAKPANPPPVVTAPHAAGPKYNPLEHL